jgi:hypothetical protein
MRLRSLVRGGMAARREPVEAMALAHSLSAGLRSHRQRSRLPQEVARRGRAVAHAYGWANRFAGDRPQIERRKLYGSARWLCVERVRQESGFGKAADRPPLTSRSVTQSPSVKHRLNLRPLRRGRCRRCYDQGHWKDRSHSITPGPGRRAARRGMCSSGRNFAGRDAIRPEREKCPTIE